MQQRTNFAIVTKEALNEFSQQLAIYTRNNTKNYNSRDWKWKIIRDTLDVGGLHNSQPMLHVKKVYWGEKLAKFYNLLLVSIGQHNYKSLNHYLFMIK